MKATGKTKITDELTLNSPTGMIRSVIYDWETDDVIVELIFKEDGGILRHSRNFIMKNDGGGIITGEEIESYIKNHPDLKAFDTAENVGWFAKLIKTLTFNK